MAKTAAAVQQYWADQLELMRTLPAEVHSRQPESIHDLRAASRRLKATVRLYQPLLRPRLANNLIELLDWYNAQLGQARDAEVIAEEVADLLDERPGARAVIAALEAEARRTAPPEMPVTTARRGSTQRLFSRKASSVCAVSQEENVWAPRSPARLTKRRLSLVP